MTYDDVVFVWPYNAVTDRYKVLKTSGRRVSVKSRTLGEACRAMGVYLVDPNAPVFGFGAKLFPVRTGLPVVAWRLLFKPPTRRA